MLALLLLLLKKCQWNFLLELIPMGVTLLTLTPMGVTSMMLNPLDVILLELVSGGVVIFLLQLCLHSLVCKSCP
jgi:hypothetical protein